MLHQLRPRRKLYKREKKKMVTAVWIDCQSALACCLSPVTNFAQALDWGRLLQAIPQHAAATSGGVAHLADDRGNARSAEIARTGLARQELDEHAPTYKAKRYDGRDRFLHKRHACSANRQPIASSVLSRSYLSQQPTMANVLSSRKDSLTDTAAGTRLHRSAKKSKVRLLECH